MIKLKKGWKPGVYTNRICGEGEAAVSAMILDLLSLDSLPSIVCFSKPSNMQYLQVVDFHKKCQSMFHSLSQIRITCNTSSSPSLRYGKSCCK